MPPRKRHRRWKEETAPASTTAVEDATPAQRYAAAQRRQYLERSETADFAGGLSFDLDDFQQQACLALEEDRSVLVAAPTGAGKTVVGEFAVHLGLRRGHKTFYTTPIKALSNQKYLDLCAIHGEENVGLLTGDTTINGEAPVVVMTTEVLRNMLYAGSTTLSGLGYVVMDEVHYLADRFRGPVWEEVILHLAPEVLLISLSATVSNAEEFGDWLTMIRGDTAVIVSETRPVPLWQHVMVRSAIHDLYSARVDPTDPGTNPPINPNLLEAIRRSRRTGSAPSSRGRRRGRGPAPGRRGRSGHQMGAMVRPAPRPVVVRRLSETELLPAIFFIFSRAGCEQAVEQTVRSGVQLTTAAEAGRIRDMIEERCATLPPEDLAVVGYHAWSQALQAGVAAHHAGLLPVFKETVEALFTAGLVKVVYATETLALGINMPARTVVLEQLDKWNGAMHADLTPGEYTQLTGRAGRRGIDVEGHAVVLYRDGLDPQALVGLASRRTYPLRSSFHPTYNMAVNLLGATTYATARQTLENSFAQFQADRGVVGLARQARKNEEALAGYAEAMTCDQGDFAEYYELRQELSRREKYHSQQRSHLQRQELAAALGALRRGDVISYRHGRRMRYALVVEADTGHLAGPQVGIMTPEPRWRSLEVGDVPHGVEVRTRLQLPEHLGPRTGTQRRELVARLEAALNRLDEEAPAGDPTGVGQQGGDDVAFVRQQLRRHPSHDCPRREDHARWAGRWYRLRHEHAELLERIERRTSSIARDFDKTCQLLVHLGYLRSADPREETPKSETLSGSGPQHGRGPEVPEEMPEELAVTADGKWLARLYAEKDLVLAECLRRGTWEDLDAAELAGVVSTIVYHSRTDTVRGAGVGPSSRLGRAVEDTIRVSDELAELERSSRVPVTDAIDMGIVSAIHSWARGAGLDDVLADSELSAGDFVRWCKQVLDVLDQLVTAAPRAEVRQHATRAIRKVRRGVVAWSSV